MVKVAQWLLTAALIGGQCFAQPADLVRLRAIVHDKEVQPHYIKDSSYTDALNNLAFAYYRINADSVFKYCRLALAAAKEANYPAGESMAWRQLGNGYKLRGDINNTLDCYHKALAIAEQINNHSLIAKASINIGMQYSDMRKTDEAGGFLKRSIPLLEELKDSLNLNKAIIGIGVLCVQRGQYDSALIYHRKALALAKAMKNNYLQTVDYDAIGVVLLAQGHYKEALTGYLYSYQYFSHTDDKIRFSVAATMVARSYVQLKQYPQALKYALEGARSAEAMHSTTQMKDASHALGEIYAAMGDYRNAVQYLRQYNQLSDTMFNDQLVKNTTRLEAKYEFEKKESALREQQEKKDALNRDIVRKKELQITVAGLAIVFLLVLTFILFRNAAARKKTNRLLEEKNEQIEQQSLQLLINNQQKDKLFGIIAHDLKAPLHSLKLALDLLKARALSEQQVNTIMDELRQDAEYSSRLVGNLLSWAASQQKGLELTPVTLPIPQLTDEVLDQFYKLAADKNIDLSARLTAPLTARADKNMVLVVLRNLLSNAIKFCRPGDSITITGKMAGNMIELCVADTGIGIGSDILEKIQQQRIITTSGTANEKGTGLGMLICHEFIALNHGHLRMVSETARGTQCYFTLPVAQAAS